MSKLTTLQYKIFIYRVYIYNSSIVSPELSDTQYDALQYKIFIYMVYIYIYIHTGLELNCFCVQCLWNLKNDSKIPAGQQGSPPISHPQFGATTGSDGENYHIHWCIALIPQFLLSIPRHPIDLSLTPLRNV